MKQKFYPPRVPYIVFELVKIDLEDYLRGSYKAIPVHTIYLAVTPSQFSYRLASRDAIMQTEGDVYVNKLDFQPEQCTISGNFGYEPRTIGGTYMTGWDRLRQFQDDIVKLSKKTNLPGIERDKYIFALNYYDFINQKFGSINIQTFVVRGNARENTMLPYYICDFIIIGDLEHTESQDLLLAQLQDLYGEEGLFASAGEVLGEVFSSTLSPVILEGELLSGAYKSVMNLLGGAEDYLNSAFMDLDSSYKNVKSLFG